MMLRVKTTHRIKQSLTLPHTTFPARSNPLAVAASLRQRCCDDLYQWQQQRTGPSFVLHDGPPYANGRLHIGHFVNKIIKDIIVRYHIIQGHRVDFRPGWDCHGLPIELKAITQTGLSPIDIRMKAKDWAIRCMEEQKEQFRSWGICADWEHSYKTLDPQYEASQLEVFKEMLRRGLVYRALKPVYWSPSTTTALAEAELEYKSDHVSNSVYCFYQLENNIQALVWTTTPWTLPGSLALSVGSDISYAIMEHSDYKPVLIAEARAHILGDGWNLSRTIPGSELIGKVAKHPFISDRTIRVIASEYVDSESGTGIVHTAPAHGKEDFEIGVRNDIGMIQAVNGDGTFNDDAGLTLIFEDGEKEVLRLLRESNSLFKIEKYTHNYPYDWRTKKPVIQRATTQWFVKLEDIHDKAIKALDAVSVVPSHGKTRLTATINSRSEWCISRQRNWGVPIPVFYYKDSGDVLAREDVIDHVIKLFRSAGSDCWWLYSVEALLPPHLKHEAPMLEKGGDTMDVWFDSGSSWHSVLKKSSDAPPSNVVVEGSDQHRGWFQSSLLTRMAFEEHTTAPYGTIITHGFVLDEGMMKMAKSQGNVIDPEAIIEGKEGFPRRGVDVLRYWVASSDFTRDLSIGSEVVEKASQATVKYRNILRFLLGCVNDFNVPRGDIDLKRLNPIDRVMMSYLTRFAKVSQEHCENYDFVKAIKCIENFAFRLVSSFYSTVSKDVLYTYPKDSAQRQAIQHVMVYVLEALLKSLSPVIPHLCDEAYENMSETCRLILNRNEQAISGMSVEATGPIAVNESFLDDKLESQFDLLFQLKDSVNLALESLRQSSDMRSSNEAELSVCAVNEELKDLLMELISCNRSSDFFSVSHVVWDDELTSSSDALHIDGLASFRLTKCKGMKCVRCWKLYYDICTATENDTEVTLCKRCIEVLTSEGFFD